MVGTASERSQSNQRKESSAQALRRVSRICRFNERYQTPKHGNRFHEFRITGIPPSSNVLQYAAHHRNFCRLRAPLERFSRVNIELAVEQGWVQTCHGENETFNFAISLREPEDRSIAE